MPCERTASDWYSAAAECYEDQHQGCAWCGGSHCVRQGRRGDYHVLTCQRCDFEVSRHEPSGRCRVIPGEELTPVSETMLEGPLSELLRRERRPG
ncbi:MAG: hypothetical protein NZO58_00915 [Gemmataceae bacterium]|nr:hypothetical protein [Gemmataceae bacterium]